MNPKLILGLALVLSGGLFGCSSINHDSSCRLMDVPQGVRFLTQARTLSDLRRAAKADLTWTELDGSPIFLWIQHGPEQSQWTFTVDQAYCIQEKDRSFWCFLDAQSGAGTDFQDPIQQFFCLKFDREQIEYPGDHGDGNQSYVELLSTNRQGAKIFKLTYCSQGGWRAEQEGVITCLIYISPDGKPSLATGDLGHEGVYPHGCMGESDGFEMKVIWTPKPAPAPFQIALRQWTSWSVASADADAPDYTTFRDGELSGRFPLKVHLDSASYVEGDGVLTLAKLADTLVFYNSDWITCDWVPKANREKVKTDVTGLWLSELQGLNPRVQPQSPIPVNKRIRVPDVYGFRDSVYEKVARPISQRLTEKNRQ
jgi:hypothetical protein